jgi:2,5-diketo-D-gluconate reductase A
VGSLDRMTSPTSPVPSIPLRDGEAIPQLGFGVFQVPPEQTADVTTRALLTGYRHIDTARIYGNEAEVGQAIHAAGVPREEVFVTTKCWNDDQGYDEATRALKRSLHQLELEHVDLYLIHWPAPGQDRYVDTWRALVDLQKAGLTRSIGVSNFQQPHLERIIAETGVVPAVNQIELSPQLQQHGLRREHADHGIVTEAWSPLAKGEVLGDPELVRIAAEHERTPAQVVLRWHIQLGNVIFPKSATPERIEENFRLFDFHLTDADMAAIETLDAGKRTGPDPDVFGA